MQFLFGLDYSQYDWESSIDAFWAVNPSRSGVREYTTRLIGGVVAHCAELDAAIHGVVENWSPERIGRVEQNILRVALYEMLYEQDVPVGVAINEAIEVAKRFGADEAPRFVNGVLDRLKPAKALPEVEPRETRS